MEDAEDLIELEQVVRDACAGEAEWPAGVVAGVHAGVDFAISHPEVAEGIRSDLEDEAGNEARQEALIARFTAILRHRAPISERVAGSTDTALVASVIGLVGDHLRMGRAEHLVDLRSEFALIVLLPYLGFEEARRWADFEGPPV